MGDAPEAGEAAGTDDRPSESFFYDGSYPLHPFLIAAASVMAMMAGNLGQTSFADILPSLAGAMVFSLAVYLLVAAVRRRFDRLTAVIASIWVAGLLFYAGLFQRLNDIVDGGYPMVRSLAPALAILALATGLVLLLRRAAAVMHSVLMGVSAVILINPVWHAVGYEWRHGAAREAYDPDRAMVEIEPYIASARDTPGQPPDIYHFIFDRYASDDVLRDHFGVDNSAMRRFLEEHGFYVARGSNSNYPKTGPSLASTFYMDYLDLLQDDDRVRGSNWHPIFKMLRDHRVARFLKSRGYDFVQFGSWWTGTYNNPTADENHPHGFSEFALLYLTQTALRPVFRALPQNTLTMRLNWDNAQCQRVAPQVREIKAVGEAHDRPVYVFAHFLLPHGPYGFATDGRCLTLEESIRRGDRQGYIDQVAYANRIIREIVTTLQSQDGPAPIIIIQADEGPFPNRDYGVPWQDATVEELRIKSGIMNAYYFPNRDYGALRPDITPVNSYRVIFNAYFGTSFPLLPDRVFFFPNDGNLYEYHDMTDKIRGPAHVAGMTGNAPPHP